MTVKFIKRFNLRHIKISLCVPFPLQILSPIPSGQVLMLGHVQLIYLYYKTSNQPLRFIYFIYTHTQIIIMYELLQKLYNSSKYKIKVQYYEKCIRYNKHYSKIAQTRCYSMTIDDMSHMT